MTSQCNYCGPGGSYKHQRILFCLILTGDMLTPDSGIKVYSYNIADPVKLAAFEKKSADLFACIKKDIEEE